QYAVTSPIVYDQGAYTATVAHLPPGRHQIYAMAWDHDGGSSITVHNITVGEEPWESQPTGEFLQDEITCEDVTSLADYCGERVDIVNTGGAPFYCIWNLSEGTVEQCS